MANPNVVSVQTVRGKTTVRSFVKTYPVNFLVNNSSSGEILKVNSLYVANKHTSPVNVTIQMVGTSTQGNTQNVIDNVAIAASSSMVLISKNTDLYITENTALSISSTQNDTISLVCSYEQISDGSPPDRYDNIIEAEEPPPPIIPIVTSGLLLHLDAANTTSYSGSGSTWFDLSGANRNATINGTVSFTDGYFNTTSDSTYISMPNTGLLPGTGDFTYSCWVYFNSFDSYDTIFENGSWQDCLLLRLENNTNMTVHAESAYRGAFTWTATASTWYNIVFMRSSTTCSMYINNVLTGTPFAMNVDINLANPNLFIMRSQHATGQFTNGRISFFSIYNKALSTEERLQNFNAVRERYNL